VIEPTPLPSGGEGDQLPRRLLRISHVFADTVREIFEGRFLRESAPAPLSLSQVHLLKLIDRNENNYFIGEIAKFLGVSAPAASKNADKLARLGLLVRVTPETDRRNTSLRITPEGRTLVHNFESRRINGLKTVLERFRKEDLQQLTDLLERFATTLIAMEENEEGACLRCGAIVEKKCPVQGVTGECPYEQARRAAQL